MNFPGKKPIYGVLGGYGVVATNRFHMLLNQRWLREGAWDDPHFPHTITANLALPVMDVAGHTLNLDLFEQTLAQNSKYFIDTFQVFALCNTFHIYENLMRTYIPNLVSFPNVLNEATFGKKNMLVAASDLTLQHNLYEGKVNYQSDSLIIAGMRNHVPYEKLQLLVNTAEQKQVEGIVLACTDLSIFTETLRTLTDIPVYDSLEILVNFIYKQNSDSF